MSPGEAEIVAGFQVIVHGVDELEAAFADLKVKVDPAVGKTLTAAGQTVAVDASIAAIANISNIGSDWSQMKSGRRQTMVYVAGSQHNQGGSPRPNLSPLLFNQALLPAARANEDATLKAVDDAMSQLCDKV